MRASLLIAQVLALAASTDPFMRDPFARLNGPRRLTREEAMVAFKPTDEDLRRATAAEAKRERKAAKLRRLS